jgi:hypothetical protein
MNYGLNRKVNERGLVIPDSLGDEQDDIHNWKALDSMLSGTHPTIDLSGGVGGGGGSSGGSSITKMAGRFVQQIVVTGETELQAAIDSAPASNTLVREITSVTALGNNTYAVASATKPTDVFVDAEIASERASRFNLTTGAFVSGTDTTPPFVWAWDAANSRVLIYKGGTAITAATLVDYVAIIALNKASYDAVALRPGIVILGLGRTVQEIRPVTAKTDTSSGNGTFEYSLRVAAYSGVIGMRVVRNGRITAGLNSCGILFAGNIPADTFFMEDAELVVEASYQKYLDSTYNVGMFLSSSEASSARAKNARFVRTPFNNYAQCDTIETFSNTFFGLVWFIDCSIHGAVYFDGNKQTIKFVNTPVDNLMGLNRQPVPMQEATNFAVNLLGAAGAAAFPGETNYMEFYNSPVSIQRTSDPAIAADVFYAIAWSGRVGLRFENSPIASEGSIRHGTNAAFNALEATRLYCRNSPMPVIEMSAYSDTYRTPLVPESRCSVAISTTTASERVVGQFSMTYEELKLRRSAAVTVHGKFAANANNKTLTFKAGLAGAQVSVKTTTGTYNDKAFTVTAVVEFANDVVRVVMGGQSDAFTGFSTIHEQALTSGQVFAMSLGMTAATAAADIVASQQSIVIGG